MMIVADKISVYVCNDSGDKIALLASPLPRGFDSWALNPWEDFNGWYLRSPVVSYYLNQPEFKECLDDWIMGTDHPSREGFAQVVGSLNANR